jgi:hypothetical protein
MRPRPLVLAVVALQVGLPLTMLVARWADEGTRAVSERPASWQMYSSIPAARYTGVDGAGRARPLDVADLPPVLRAVDVGRTLPDRLCARHADLVAVRRVGTDAGVFRC